MESSQITLFEHGFAAQKVPQNSQKVRSHCILGHGTAICLMVNSFSVIHTGNYWSQLACAHTWWKCQKNKWKKSQAKYGNG